MVAVPLHVPERPLTEDDIRFGEESEAAFLVVDIVPVPLVDDDTVTRGFELRHDLRQELQVMASDEDVERHRLSLPYGWPRLSRRNGRKGVCLLVDDRGVDRDSRRVRVGYLADVFDDVLPGKDLVIG
ncbi:hypothetical protein GY12_26035 [Micrococcus luteus]|nr:hypothetical protein GY12_26035 [Micrococcus luteus]